MKAVGAAAAVLAGDGAEGFTRPAQPVTESGRAERRAYAGFKGVADLLNRLEPVPAQRDPEGNRKGRRQAGMTIRNLMFTFEDLLTVPDTGIREILAQLDKKTLAVALKTSSQESKIIFSSRCRRAPSTC